MPLADRLSSPPARRSRQCAVGRILTALPESDRSALRAVLAADPEEWPTSDILRELRAEGHETSYATLGRHRRGDCPCRSLTA